MNDRVWYAAYDYDFNDPHGEIVVYREHDLKLGDKIMLVSIEGNRRTDDYEGFGVLATVIEIIPAHHPDYLRLRTDYRR